MTIDNSSTLKSTKSSRELHLELERRGSEGVSPVTGDEVQDCPLLLSRVARLELVEGAQVEHGRLLQQQHRLLGQPENGDGSVSSSMALSYLEVPSPRGRRQVW